MLKNCNAPAGNTVNVTKKVFNLLLLQFDTWPKLLNLKACTHLSPTLKRNPLRQGPALEKATTSQRQTVYVATGTVPQQPVDAIESGHFTESKPRTFGIQASLLTLV